MPIVLAEGLGIMHQKMYVMEKEKAYTKDKRV